MIHEIRNAFPGISCATLDATGKVETEYYGISDKEKNDYVMSMLVWNDEMDRVMIEFCFDKDENIQWMKFERFMPSDVMDSERERLFELGKARAQRLVKKHLASSKGKIGRNELCPCGSGKKYKKCCLRN